MLKSRRRAQQGFTLLEALISMVILAFGVLSIATLQSRTMTGQIESFQRAQAVLALNDISQRLSLNAANASSYVTTTPLGTGDSQPSSCTSAAAGAARDLCEWSASLKGASATQGGVANGGIVGARGCIAELRAPNATAGICTPGLYSVTVAWQGLSATIAPANSCGATLYGSDDGFRRAISTRVTVPLSAC